MTNIPLPKRDPFQHSQGEWHQQKTSADQFIIYTESGKNIAVIYTNTEANARVITAAPVMVEALYRIASTDFQSPADFKAWAQELATDVMRELGIEVPSE